MVYLKEQNLHRGGSLMELTVSNRRVFQNNMALSSVESMHIHARVKREHQAIRTPLVFVLPLFKDTCIYSPIQYG